MKSYQKSYTLQNTIPLLKVSYFQIKILGRGSRERYTLCAGESGGSLRNCKDMGLFEQAFEHIKECNTWNKTTCPRWVKSVQYGNMGCRDFKGGTQNLKKISA